MEPIASTTTPAADARCPHCQLVVAEAVQLPWPDAPLRCPHCRLMIGVGRGRTDASGRPGAKGAAAGVFSRQARTPADRDGAQPSPDRILRDILAAAAAIGERPERLLMVDYQQHAATHAALTPLADLLAAFGSWKRARRLASEHRGKDAGEPCRAA